MVDYLSKLPESVIHHILSFLPFDEIGRTSTLSKDWYRIWLSYPNVEFHFKHFYGRKKDFLDDIEKSLGRCLVKRVCIQNFNLTIGFPDIKMLTPNLDRWLDLALKKNVSKLALGTGRFFKFIDSDQVFYSIPEELLVANTLEVLDLHQCNLEEDRLGSISLPRLGKLSLFECRFVGGSLLQKIVSACPIVEHISILTCTGVGRFLSVSCKPQLKYFKVDWCNELEKIEIDAPNLHTLSYCTSNKACAIDMSNWSSVKELELGNAILMQLDYFLSKFLCIEVLKLSNHEESEKFKISSQSLKRLVLGFFLEFPDAKIDAPNLLTLEFSLCFDLSSELKFSSWNVPKVDDINMKFSVENFPKACEAGLEDFLMKLHNYEDLKLVIFHPNYHNFVMIDKLHAVSFSSLREMVKGSRVRYVLISSRDETYLAQMLGKPEIKNAATIYMMCSSHESAESFCKKLGNHSIVKDNYRLLELVSPEEVELRMNCALRKFLKSNSRGFNHSAALILHKRDPMEDQVDHVKSLISSYRFYQSPLPFL